MENPKIEGFINFLKQSNGEYDVNKMTNKSLKNDKEISVGSLEDVRDDQEKKFDGKMNPETEKAYHLLIQIILFWVPLISIIAILFLYICVYCIPNVYYWYATESKLQVIFLMTSAVIICISLFFLLFQIFKTPNINIQPIVSRTPA